MPPRQNLRELLWESLPAAGLITILSFVSGDLEHYQWFSPPANIYIWTLIWIAIFLASWKLRIKQGPLMVVAHGSVRNVYMLKDLYDLLGVERCDFGRTVGVADLVGGGVCSALACGGCLYLAMHFCYAPRGDTGDDVRGGDEEKTPQGCKI
jgi:hypothetical protein